MSDARGPDGHQLCVLFHEAVAWIAVRNFSGGVAIGPRPLNELPYGDLSDEEYDINIGRHLLAQQLLVNSAVKGRIRIYARNGWSDNDEDAAALSFPFQLTAGFLSRAEHEFDQGEGHTIFVREEQGYNELVVSYDDLIREFWTDTAPQIAIRELTAIAIRETTTRTAPAPLRRRGPRSRYPWPNFVAELVRFAMGEPEIDRLAALERHMLEWCATTWDAEPAASEIRYWVSPTYQMLRDLRTAVQRPDGIAGNSW